MLGDFAVCLVYISLICSFHITIQITLQSNKSPVLTRYSCDDFANLKAVEYGGFASAIKSQNQYSPFSGPEQTTEVTEQPSCVPHKHIDELLCELILR